MTNKKLRILVDTNVMISALLFPKSKPSQSLLLVTEQHELVLCDRNIRELKEVLRRKLPRLLPDLEVLLAELSYELIPEINHAEKLIRDIKDQPILNAAIVYNVDIILTGDKDFLCLGMDHPKCMNPSDFLDHLSNI